MFANGLIVIVDLDWRGKYQFHQRTVRRADCERRLQRDDEGDVGGGVEGGEEGEIKLLLLGNKKVVGGISRRLLELLMKPERCRAYFDCSQRV